MIKFSLLLDISQHSAYIFHFFKNFCLTSSSELSIILFKLLYTKQVGIIKYFSEGGQTLTHRLIKGYRIMSSSPGLTVLNWLFGIFVHVPTFFYYRIKFRDFKKQTLTANPIFIQKLARDYDARARYFGQEINERKKQTFINKEYKKAVSDIHVPDVMTRYSLFFENQLSKRSFLFLTFIPGILLYLLFFIYHQGLVRFVVERLVATGFVIVSVIIIVFSLLYFSPQDPAQNILGEQATQLQRDNFNRTHGLDQSYIAQLTDRLHGFITFDLGSTFAGNEDVLQNIENRFPVTLAIAFSSLALAVMIAIPIGMISAIYVRSFWDYSFMFLALIGLSIPSFWQGLIFILTFAIELDWLPSTYTPGNIASLIMPVVVLGTGLSATIARMTRSEILEVMHEDYMMTAKAKGLSKQRMFTRHALPNAWIPILTVIGLQFGAMLGGASVTEKVFNIKGLGSYIVDKQFIPDIPAILAGVVYMAIMISVVNLVVDLLYALLNPRLRAELNDG